MLLEVKDLKTIFSTQDGVVNAVNGISYVLDAGEALGIIGESGCGKSVSVLSIMRLIPEPPGEIVDGEVWFQGRDLLKMSLRELRDVRGNRIAMIFQDPMSSLNPVLKIKDQIGEVLKTHLGMDKVTAKKRTIDLLEKVGIPSPSQRIDDYPHQFSGGMRQRVMIAMALACEPQILIADEPTTSLDVTIQSQILELLVHLSKIMSMSIILITHNLGIVAQTCKKVLVMYKGEIVESQGKGQNVEIHVKNIEILGISHPDNYPIQPKKHSFEFLRENEKIGAC